MRLEDRLRELDKSRPATRKKTVGPDPEGKLLKMAEGTLERNRRGEFVLIRKSFDAPRLGEEIRLRGQVDVAGEMLARICSSKKSRQQDGPPARFDLTKAAFFDCETTGLAGGAGTYAFLIGVGFMSGDEFVVEQYFMQDFHQEGAVLTAVAERLAGFEFLVSYNGKCFDLPLLETRWTIHRIDHDREAWFHVDLLYPSRRLWKRRLADCSLSNVESRILGVKRKADVPSHLVPQIYFDYLRSGEAEPLLGVFYHNRYDILSLLGLSITIDGLLEDLDPGRFLEPEDLLSLGKIHRYLGNHQTGADCLKRALSQKLPPELNLEVSFGLASLYRRIGLSDDAAEVWHTLIGGDLPFSLRAHVELAKYYEHKKREYRRALSLVEIAISHLASDLPWSDQKAKQSRLDALEYRRARLEKRIRRASGSAPSG
jgi:uncharacterized protein YprB with RNaseH-like and TPR domain